MMDISESMKAVLQLTMLQVAGAPQPQQLKKALLMFGILFAVTDKKLSQKWQQKLQCLLEVITGLSSMICACIGVCQHTVPRILSSEQKEMQMAVSGDLIAMANTDKNFLNNIVTGDGTWCFLYDSKAKHLFSEWKTSVLLKKKKTHHFFGQRNAVRTEAKEILHPPPDIIHKKFISEGQTVNKEMYTDILHHLTDAIKRKPPQK